MDSFSLAVGDLMHNIYLGLVAWVGINLLWNFLVISFCESDNMPICCWFSISTLTSLSILSFRMSLLNYDDILSSSSGITIFLEHSGSIRFTGCIYLGFVKGGLIANCMLVFYSFMSLLSWLPGDDYCTAILWLFLNCC